MSKMIARRSSLNRFTWIDALIYAVVLIVALVCFLPFIYVFSVSFTDPSVYIPYQFSVIPKKFSLAAYRQILSTNDFLNALKNTLLSTVGGTSLGIATTFTFAYGLTKKDLPFHKLFMFVVLFGLLFDVGMIPNYINVRELGLINTYWALILPALATSYNVIIAKSFIEGMPQELEEAATIDGASYLRIFLSIIVPLSKASIATLTLFIAVDQWNQYTRPLMYTTSQSMHTLQIYIKMMLTDAAADGIGVGDVDNVLPSETIRLASVVLTMLPIMCIYPFVQKYFVKGVMIGSVKG